MTREVEIEGQIYLVSRFPAGTTGSARKAFHVLRRLLPVASGGLGALLARNSDFFDMVPQPPDPDEPPGPEVVDEPETAVSLVNGRAQFIEGVGVLVDALGKMPDADADYVINACLDAVKFKTGGGWQNLRASNGRLMFEPADDFLIQAGLVWEVLKENLANFSVARLLAILGVNLPTG